MLFLKLYLFSGLVLHKLIWELLRSQSQVKPIESKSLALMATKAVKLGILIAIVIQIWLPDIFPISQESTSIRAVGVFIYTAGLVTAIAARFQLGTNWANIETGQVLKNQQVVAVGIYNYIRHPIYIGDLLLLFGLELALNSWLVLGVLFLAPFVLLKAIGEEKMLAGELPGYEAYCQRSKRFIPFVF